MPFESNYKVCPTDAILLDDNNLMPYVLSDECISCGLCITRCIYGAISYDEAFKAIINQETNEIVSFEDKMDKDNYNLRINTFANAKKEIDIETIPKELVNIFYKNTKELTKNINGFENIIVRNFLINLKVPSKTRAIGNNDIRVDLIGEKNDCVILSEIDLFGLDILDSTRSILDDIAVFFSRHSLLKEKIVPIIFIGSFPNKRSDYYEVISDIEKITGFKIMTLPLQLLFVLNLFKEDLQIEKMKGNFKVNLNNNSVKEDVKKYYPIIEEVDPQLDSNMYSAIK
jgi:ferredoxin